MSRFTSTSKHRISRRRFLSAAGHIAGASGLAVFGAGRTALAQQDGAATELNGLSVLKSGAFNVVALPGENGALMIDGGPAASADAVLRAVFAATGNERVDTLINTHWHPEQVGANERVGAAGGVIFAHEKTALYLSHPVYSPLYEGEIAALAEAGRPTATTRDDGTLTFGNERIDYGYLPQAHTDGDLYLQFPERNVLIAGGVVSGERWPLLDYNNGAWYGGRVRALQWLAEIVEPDTRVVPAEGRLISGRDIVRQRDIYLELFETLIAYMNRGFGAEDAVENNPLAEYEAEFGDPSAFLDGAYRSMLIAYVPD